MANLSAFPLVVLALLACLVLFEGACIFALFRQVGLLHITLSGDRVVRYQPESVVDPLPPGTVPPELEASSIHGGSISLSDRIGRPVFLAFVHPLCSPCNVIGSELEALSRDREQQTHVIVVSDGDRLSTEEYVREHHLRVPTLYEPRADFTRPASALQKFRIPRTPFAYLLDERGRVVVSGTIGSKEAFWRVVDGLSDVSPLLAQCIAPVEAARAVEPA